MPHLDQTVVTELEDTIGNGPTYYYGNLNLDENRTHASQLLVLFYYTTTAGSNATDVANLNVTNWYDAYRLPPALADGTEILTFNASTRTVTIGNTNLVTFKDAAGVSYTMPTFANGTKVRIMRSENVSTIAQDFAPGSRVTSQGLNSGFQQVFKSVQELEGRVAKVEGATFEEVLGLTLEELGDVNLNSTKNTWDVIRWNGSKFTNNQMDATQISAGTLPDARLPIVPVAKGGTGASTASAARIALGTNDAANISTGTISNDRLSSNIPVSKLAGTLADSQVQESNVTQHATAVGNALTFTTLSDVNITGLLGNGSFLVYDTASSKWVNKSPADSRTSLGLGTSATVNTGTSANQIVKLDGSAKLPAIDGSQLTNLPSSGGGGNDYLSKPSYTNNQVRLFDDFYQCTPDRIDAGLNQWWLMSGGSGVIPGDFVDTAVRGAASIPINAQNNRRFTFWGAMFVTGADAADGDELLWETRVRLTDNSSTTGALRVGFIDWDNTLNYNDSTPVGDGYTGFDFASIAISLADTNLIIGHKDTGNAANATKVDLGSSYPKSSYVDTFVRLGAQVKYNNTDSDWDLTFYVNGVSVHTLSMTFSSGIVPYIGMGHGTQTGAHSMEIDWISYQAKQGSPPSGRTTHLDIESV